VPANVNPAIAGAQREYRIAFLTAATALQQAVDEIMAADQS
jgi:hypothetical protein